MLLLWLLPEVALWPWAVVVVCAWTAVAPNMAAATEAPSRPFSS
jgi:hypothetical protein